VLLIERVTSDEVIERAYEWVCQRRKHYHHVIRARSDRFSYDVKTPVPEFGVPFSSALLTARTPTFALNGYPQIRLKSGNVDFFYHFSGSARKLYILALDRHLSIEVA